MKASILYWLPRILIVIYLIFISLFALDELGNTLGFVIHLIPSFIVLTVAIYIWKNELFGGLLLIILGIIFSIYFRNIYAFIAVAVPLIVIGLLFVYQSRKENERG
jgi:hypothetical protein